MKRKGRVKRDNDSREREQKSTTHLTNSVSKPFTVSKSRHITSPQEPLEFGKDTREELDFQFDEELESLPKTGRHHDFSEW